MVVAVTLGQCSEHPIRVSPEALRTGVKHIVPIVCSTL